MSAGSSLYRRHRPRTFAEVVGQQHVVRTLTNAVERDRVDLAAYERLLALDFDTLLLAHGDPIAGGGKDALRSFVESAAAG